MASATESIVLRLLPRERCQQQEAGAPSMASATESMVLRLLPRERRVTAWLSVRSRASSSVSTA